MVVFSSPGYSGPQEVSYLFIDNGCLREIVRDISMRYFGAETYLSINYAALLSGHQKAFVYDATSAQEHRETEQEWLARIEGDMKQINAIKALPGYHVQLGDRRGKKGRQKRVDVQLTADMLMHTFRRNMHRCSLIAGDGDFVPLLEALVREGMYVSLRHPLRPSADLVNTADSAEQLNVRTLSSALVGPLGMQVVPVEFYPGSLETAGLIFEWAENNKFYRLHHQHPAWTLYEETQNSTVAVRADHIKAVTAFAHEFWSLDTARFDDLISAEQAGRQLTAN